MRRHAPFLFRYPQGGNPRLVHALAGLHGVDPCRVAVGNGSDEIIDLLIRILAEPGKHSLACFEPCFSIYPIQGRISGVEVRRCPLEKDFSFNFDALLGLVDQSTRLVFVTTPDNPSGYCPPREAVADLARRLAGLAPDCLLVVDEAYMDFAENEASASLLASGTLPENTAFLRTFSKSWGLAGLRLGYGVLPSALAEYFWRGASALLRQHPGGRGGAGRPVGHGLPSGDSGRCAPGTRHTVRRASRSWVARSGPARPIFCFSNCLRARVRPGTALRVCSGEASSSAR